MVKILSLILSVIIAFLNMIPGFSGLDSEAISVGEWLSLANTTFGMNYDEAGAKLDTIPVEDQYYQAMQTAYQWGILEGYETIKSTETLKGEFAAVALVRYARLTFNELKVEIANAERIKNIKEVTIAVANGIFDLDDKNNFFKGKLKREDAIEAINKAFDIWSNLVVDEKNKTELQADVIELVDGDGYELKNDSAVFDKNTGVKEGSTVVLEEGVYTVDNAVEKNGEIVADVTKGELEDAYKSVDFSSSVTPQFSLAQVKDNEGNVIKEAISEEALEEQFSLEDITDQLNWEDIKGKLLEKGKEALLKKAKISFDIGDISVDARLKDDGLSVVLGGYICEGVGVSEVLDISNFKLQTKFKANLAKKDIKEAYIVADYTVTSNTNLVGSYAGNLVEKESDLSDELNFFEKIKENLFTLKPGSGNRITIYTVDVPIAQVPGLIFTIDFGLELDVSGRITVSVMTKETKGYEIINNKGRFIHSTSYVDSNFNVNGDFSALLSMDFILKYVTTNLMDVAFSAGLGANVTTIVFKDNQETAIDGLPLDVAVEAASVTEFFDDIKVCANVKLYGILEVSVGQNSLMKKIGLKKSWTILDADNATIANLHVEESGIVDNCTRAA